MKILIQLFLDIILKMGLSKSKPCVFCDLLKDGSKVIQSNGDVATFKDRSPASDHHYLVVPTKFVTNPKTLESQHIPLIHDLESFALDFIKSTIGERFDNKELLIGFHWPPFISVEHLHLHVIYPKSNLNQLGRWKFPNDSWYFLSPSKLIDYLKNKKA